MKEGLYRNNYLNSDSKALSEPFGGLAQSLSRCRVSAYF